MATNEPMTGERLAQIQARNDNLQQVRQAGPHNFSDLEYERLCQVAMGYADDVPALLAEVDRLRAREQVLQLQLNAMSSLLLDVQRDCVVAQQEANAMRPVVEAVADIENSDGSACYVTCDLTLFDVELDLPDDVRHNVPCLIEQAQAFVAAHPTTAAGEGESEGE